MSQRPPRHPITVDEYYRLADTGALDPAARVELIEGHGVPEVWICDLTTSQVHVFRSPKQGHHTETCTVGREGVIRPAAFDGTTIDLSQLVWALRLT